MAFQSRQAGIGIHLVAFLGGEEWRSASLKNRVDDESHKGSNVEG